MVQNERRGEREHAMHQGHCPLKARIRRGERKKRHCHMPSAQALLLSMPHMGFVKCSSPPMFIHLISSPMKSLLPVVVVSGGENLKQAIVGKIINVECLGQHGEAQHLHPWLLTGLLIAQCEAPGTLPGYHLTFQGFTFLISCVRNAREVRCIIS